MTEVVPRPENRRSRLPAKMFLFAGFAAGILVLIWGSGILYWHLRLRSAMRTFEETIPWTRNGTDHRERNEKAIKILIEAGCRSLPYMVDSLEDSKDPSFLSLMSFAISFGSMFPGVSWMDIDSPELNRRMEAWHFMPQAPAVERRLKCERIRRWWEEHGAEHHQIWRFWTNDCRPKAPVDPRELVD